MRATRLNYHQETNGARDDRKNVLKQIDEQNDKLRKARELMLTSRIDPEDYTLIKREIAVLLNKLEVKLTDFTVNPVRLNDFFIKAINIISNIPVLYQGADNEGKRAIIGSMFPEKLRFDGYQHRTIRINKVSKFISLIFSNLKYKKERARTDKSALPTRVIPIGLFSNHLLENLKFLAAC
jgi:hypothetical protein